MKTSDLCDAHPDLRVLAPIFRDYGGVREFHGEITTLKVYEDNALVRSTLETPGNGRVLVIDGSGSLRAALVGGNLGKLAETNGWAGIVVHGAVRDVAELAACNVGIKALGSTPKRSDRSGEGARDAILTLAGESFRAGDWLYADEDGIAIADGPLAG